MACLSALPDSHRQLIPLRFLDGLPTAKATDNATVVLDLPKTYNGEIVELLKNFPKIELKGNGDYRLGYLSTRTGRTMTRAMGAGTSIGQNVNVPDGGGYTDHIADDTTEGWVGVTYAGGIFTCIEKGLYQFEYGFNWAAVGTFSRRWIMAALNTTTPTLDNSYRAKTEVSGSGNFLSTLRFDIQLNVGDTIRAAFRQDAATSLGTTVSQGPFINGVQYARYVQIVRKA